MKTKPIEKEVESCPAERDENRKYRCIFQEQPCEYRNDRWKCPIRRTLRPLYSANEWYAK